ncbi:MAG: transporter, partial [Candidatus Thiodiazotropha sp. (ex Myrtea spinifera)]|nr:transporter [Candidatus Thiodiazotropha sp. (ex Myrtea spinifera)]
MTSDKANKTKDTSGRDRIVKNVFTSWGSHLVLVIVGFIMPRMIDTHLGKNSLGIWDMSWSFVNYLSLSGMGVGSSVNRYVAKYYSGNDFQSLNKAVSSVAAIQVVIAFIVVTGTGMLVLFLPNYLIDWNNDEVSQAISVIGLLGLSLAVQMFFDSFRGVITGLHRWDLHNGLNASASLLAAVLMIVSLTFGNSLVSLAVIYLIVTSVTELIRVYLAFSVCRKLDLKVNYISKFHIKKMLKFGLKSIVAGASPLVVLQT